MVLLVLACRPAKYREFHQLYERASYVVAGKLLVSLLCSNTVPKRYIIVYCSLLRFTGAVCLQILAHSTH